MKKRCITGIGKRKHEKERRTGDKKDIYIYMFVCKIDKEIRG